MQSDQVAPSSSWPTATAGLAQAGSHPESRAVGPPASALRHDLPAMLEFDAVETRIGSRTVVRDLSFSVPRGGIFGLLGANGAGKTTSLRLAMGLLRPSGGSIRVLGGRPSTRRASSIGFLPEERGLYGSLTALESVRYFGRLKGMSAEAATTSAKGLLSRFGMEDRADVRIDQLSKGMAQKVQLAGALVNSPALLVLDEPFSGLDPINQTLLETEILSAAGRGAAVVLSTHVMQHAERLCDELLVLRAGLTVFKGTPATALELVRPEVRVITTHDATAWPETEAGEVMDVEDGWTSWRLRLAAGATPADLLQRCSNQGVPLRGFDVRRRNLHDAFIDLAA